MISKLLETNAKLKKQQKLQQLQYHYYKQQL